MGIEDEIAKIREDVDTCLCQIRLMNDKLDKILKQDKRIYQGSEQESRIKKSLA
jgi:hypothetical protein